MDTKVLDILKNVNVKKTAIYVGGALLLVIMALYVRKKIREAKAEKKTENYLKLVQQGVTVSDLSYSEADYLSMADALYQHFSDTGLSAGFLGVNQKGVYGIMEMMHSDSDISQLEVAFGERKLKDLSLWGPAFSFLAKAKPYTLNEAMVQLLTNGERKKVNEILEKNGLKKRYN